MRDSERPARCGNFSPARAAYGHACPNAEVKEFAVPCQRVMPRVLRQRNGPLARNLGDKGASNPVAGGIRSRDRLLGFVEMQ